MIYRASSRFSRAFKQLTPEVQAQARDALRRFKVDRQQSSLQVKRVQGTEGVWEARITLAYRFTFHYETDPDSGDTVCVFRNIGPHNILDRNP